MALYLSHKNVHHQELLGAVSEDTLKSAIPAQQSQPPQPPQPPAQTVAVQVAAAGSEQSGQDDEFVESYDPYSGKGDYDIASIPCHHHLRMLPYTLDSEPTKVEFDWQPRSLKEAMSDYLTWLRVMAPTSTAAE